MTKPDMPVWRANEYILASTDFGKNKHWADIRWALDQAIKKGHIAIWAKDLPIRDFIKMDAALLKELNLWYSPHNKFGSLQRQSDYMQWCEPTFSSAEIHRYFAQTPEEIDKLLE